MKIVQVLICGISVGAGISTAFLEMWLASAACFVSFAVGLLLVVRSALRRTS